MELFTSKIFLNSVIRIAYLADIKIASHIGNAVKKSLTRAAAWWFKGVDLYSILLNDMLSLFSFGM